MHTHDPDKKEKLKKKTRDFKCDFEGCDQAFFTENLLRCHKYKHTGIICDICGKVWLHFGFLLQSNIRDFDSAKYFECL